MRGFFPFDYAQGQNDKQKQDDEQNRQRPMRGSFDSLRSLRMTSVNRQRQGQMRGFFPFDYAQGQNDKQKQDDEQNKQR
jgi:hypothetical protein